MTTLSRDPWTYRLSNSDVERVLAKAHERHAASKRHWTFDEAVGKKHLQALVAEEVVAAYLGEHVDASHAGGDRQPDFIVSRPNGDVYIEVVSTRENFSPVAPAFQVNDGTIRRCRRHVEEGSAVDVVFIFVSVSGAPDLDADGNVVEEHEEGRLFDPPEAEVAGRVRGHTDWRDVAALPLSGFGMRHVPPAILKEGIPWGLLAGA